MKKILSVLLMLMVVSSVVFARPIDNPVTTTGVAVMKSGTTFKLYYKGAEQSDVKVAILDSGERLVFSETIKKVDGFVRPYNFANLPEGNYTIEISDKTGRHAEKVKYSKGKVEKFVNVVKVTGAGDKYLLTVSNKQADDITVKIFDETNNVIYSQRERVISDFAKIYNLERFSGKFIFEITDSKGITKSLTK